MPIERWADKYSLSSYGGKGILEHFIATNISEHANLMLDNWLADG